MKSLDKPNSRLTKFNFKYYLHLPKHLTNVYLCLTTVPSKPWIYDITRDTVTNASEEAKLTCKAKGYPQADITWFFRDGTKIQGCYVERCDYEIWTDKRENKSESILTIKKVKYEDGGVYRCRAANEHGQNNSTTKLVVQSKHTKC